MRKRVEILSGEIKSKNSGHIGNNAKAQGNMAGRDINSTQVNIFSGLFKNYMKSEIFNVVREIEKSAKSYYTTAENLVTNPDWDDKIRYNELNTWKKHFDNCAIRLNNFENTIIVKLVSADKLLNYLKQIYIDKQSTGLSGDGLCDNIYQKLEEVVKSGDIKKISTESIKEGIIATMYWAFTRCQILENPLPVSRSD